MSDMSPVDGTTVTFSELSYEVCIGTTRFGCQLSPFSSAVAPGSWQSAPLDLQCGALHYATIRATNCAAALAGRPSFGKGKIQAVFGLADDSGLIVTVANYLTPAGTAIQGVGLTPEAGLRGPGLGLLEPPLPSAAQFDDAWDHRVCATK